MVDGHTAHAEDLEPDWSIYELSTALFDHVHAVQSIIFGKKLRIVTGMAYTSAGGKKRVCYYYDGR